MEAEKRKIIINEIENWRGSRLLPEHYCDFLLNLYLEDQTESPKKWKSTSKSSIQNSNWKVWIFVFGGLGLLAFVLLNFNSFQIPMQISISAIIILLLYIVGVRLRDKKPLISYLCFSLSSLLILNVGLYILYRNDVDTVGLVAYAFICSLIWIINGIAARMATFHFAGWILLIVIYGWILQRNIDDYDWLMLQMSWVPVSVVLLWLGWLMHHNNKKVGNVLLLVGFLVWFVPDIYGLLLTEIPRGILQSSTIARIVIAGIALFTLRKKWTEWVV